MNRWIYEPMSFVRHLPNYYRSHVRKVARLYFANLPGNAVVIDRTHYIVPPLSSSVTHAVWTEHTNFSCVRENRMFRALREGCQTFLDLGSAEGYYSALFAVTARGPSRIVAVDLSPRMCALHHEVIEANSKLSGHQTDWTVHQVAILDRAGTTTLGEGFHESLTNWSDCDPSRPVESVTLKDFVTRLDMIPDLVKLDIESYEFEVLTSNLDWLADVRPKIHLELHVDMMRGRGKSPDQLLSSLRKIYRVADSWQRGYGDIRWLSLAPEIA